jgi:hypothetical protein
LKEIAETEGEEALAVWAKRALPLKNELTEDDANSVEAAYLAKITEPQAPHSPDPLVSDTVATGSHPPAASIASIQVTPLAKPIRRRNKAHLCIVASQSCLVCKGRPCDPHHLKMAQPQSLGRKVSDEFTVPLCAGIIESCTDMATSVPGGKTRGSILFPLQQSFGRGRIRSLLPPRKMCATLSIAEKTIVRHLRTDLLP